jgi:hypothetical protein
MGNFLTTASTMQCPHGGQVLAVPSDPSVSFGGNPIVLQNDTFTIVGCPFNIALAPHPCVQVKWIVAALRSTAGNAPLTTDSVGLCVAADHAPQGTVLIINTQQKAGGL